MESKKVIAIIGILTVLLIGGPVIANKTLLHHRELNIGMTAQVLKSGKNITAGVDVGPNLNFGKISKGSNITKFINISAKGNYVGKVKAEGNISKHLKYDRTIRGEGKEKIPLEMIGSDPGNYTGNLKLEVDIPKNEFGEKWMNIKQKYF